MMLFLILIIAFIGIIVLSSVYHKIVVIPRAKRELGEALNSEEETVINKINAAVSTAEQMFDAEEDPLIQTAIKAFISNYAYVQLHNLYEQRKNGFESRKDFKLEFVQNFYEENNEKLQSLERVDYNLQNCIGKDLFDAYNQLSMAFSNLCRSGMVKRGTKQIELAPQSFFYLGVDDCSVPSFEISGGRIFIYPTYVIVYKGDADFSFIPLSAAQCEIVEKTETTQYGARSPFDAEIVSRRWLHSTKSGEPDARYKNNPCCYTFKTFIISLYPFFFTYSFSNRTYAYKFVDMLHILPLKEPLVKQKSVKTLGGSTIVKRALSAKATPKDNIDVVLRKCIEDDSMFLDAAIFIVESGVVQTSAVQRQFSVGYCRATKLIDMMENVGIVSAIDIENHRRSVTCGIDEFNALVKLRMDYKS